MVEKGQIRTPYHVSGTIDFQNRSGKPSRFSSPKSKFGAQAQQRSGNAGFGDRYVANYTT